MAFLRTNASQPEVDQLNLEQAVGTSTQSTRIGSPDLILREQVTSFKKDMIETVDDDNLTLNFPPSGSPQAILQLTGTLSVEEGEAILEIVNSTR